MGVAQRGRLFSAPSKGKHAQMEMFARSLFCFRWPGRRYQSAAAVVSKCRLELRAIFVARVRLLRRSGFFFLFFLIDWYLLAIALGSL